VSFRAEFQHREELLRAAIDEFTERGYDAASLNRILVRSGMSKGQLYHHFHGKEGLYLGLVEWMIDRKLEWFVSNPLPASEGDFFERLRGVLEANVAFAEANPEVERLSRALLAERGTDIFSAVVQRFGFEPDGALGAMVRQACADGELGRDLSVDFVVRLVTVVINNLPELLDLREPRSLSLRSDELLRVLRRGLGGPDPTLSQPRQEAARVARDRPA
jgi:AcrR family transcriptional regulator